MFLRKSFVIIAMLVTIGALGPRNAAEASDAIADCGARFASMAVDAENAGDLAIQERYERFTTHAIGLVGAEAVSDAVMLVVFQQAVDPSGFDAALATCEEVFDATFPEGTQQDQQDSEQGEETRI